MKANYKSTINRLKRIRGQVDGIINMVENDKYCLEISNQLMAVSSAVNSLNRQVLSAHLKSCMVESLKDDKVNVEEKIAEIESIILKLGK